MFDFLPARVQQDPRIISRFTDAQWDFLIRQGRSSNLLSRVHALIERAGLLDQVPASPRRHLESARRVADKQAVAVAWEARQIATSLKGETDAVVLLKGAAYTLGQHDAALGRVFTDIDILVRRDVINRVEAALMLAGWHSGQHDAYDQRYYRRWMHEIPPMQHIRRLTVIDVHHAILPLTARLQSNVAPLWEALVPIGLYPGLFTLSPIDMVLHSATHLFTGEIDQGLRDLSDIDLLLRQHGSESFWDALSGRAKELGLSRPLYYALRWCERIYRTPVPVSLAPDLDKPVLIAPLMDALLARALMPKHQSTQDWLSGLARFMLYVRAHWIRMPLHLLVPHLLHKALIKPEEAP
ncbi:MAG: nucleotidyltransferase family protein [Thiobacillaceae bacterium]